MTLGVQWIVFPVINCLMPGIVERISRVVGSIIGSSESGGGGGGVLPAGASTTMLDCVVTLLQVGGSAQVKLEVHLDCWSVTCGEV